MDDCSVNHSYTDNSTFDDDPFNSIAMADSQLTRTGYDEGFIQGQKTGLIEGISLGKKKGAEAAHELGYYWGFCNCALIVAKANQHQSKRQQKVVLLLNNILLTINAIGSEDMCRPTIVDELSKIRSQFKQVEALLCKRKTQTPTNSLTF